MSCGEVEIVCVKHGRQAAFPDAQLDVYCPVCFREGIHRMMTDSRVVLPNPQPYRKEYSMGTSLDDD